MAKQISDAQTLLAYRLGQNQSPTVAGELAKRRAWFSEAISNVLKKQPMWFTETKYTTTTVAEQMTYTLPTDFRKIKEVRIDNYRYEFVPFSDVYDRVLNTTRPVPILPGFQKRIFWIYNNELNFAPVPGTAPSAVSVTSITRSGTTATVTTSTTHGFSQGHTVTIAGAVESDYNGQIEVLAVPSDTTFTYSVSNSPTTPATGTITATLNNLEIFYFNNPDLPTAESDGIIIPDNYVNLIVAYAEGRYWSTAHKRAKASDGFLEYENLVADLEKENFRRGMGQVTLN